MEQISSPPEVELDFIETLKEWMDTRGVSQKWLTDQLGVSRSWFTRIHNGSLPLVPEREQEIREVFRKFFNKEF